jgi:prepilin-type N-terminal cleavage/methylation domain-containing protein
VFRHGVIHASRITHSSSRSTFYVSRFTVHVSGSALRTPHSALRTGFTLIEIMVVVLIMGITLTMSVPLAYKLWHKAPMRQSVKDIFEVCQNARRHAIYSNQPAELVFRPRERRLYVAGMTGEGTSSKLGDGVMIDLLDINMSGVEYRDADEVKVKFYPTGTSDEMKMVLRYEAEQIGIELELTTGLASVVPDPLRAWARR